MSEASQASKKSTNDIFKGLKAKNLSIQNFISSENILQKCEGEIKDLETKGIYEQQTYPTTNVNGSSGKRNMIEVKNSDLN